MLVKQSVEDIDKQIAALRKKRKYAVEKERKLQNDCNLKLVNAVSRKLGLAWNEINYVGLFAFLEANKDELLDIIKQEKAEALEQQQRLDKVIKEQRS